MSDLVAEPFYEEKVDIPITVPCGYIFLSIDIGCSLIKIAHVSCKYCQRKDKDTDPPPCTNCDKKGPTNATICFASFRNTQIDVCLNFVKDVVNCSKFRPVIRGLGVGTMKFRDEIKLKLGVDCLEESDEFCGFAKGFHFITTQPQLKELYTRPVCDPVINLEEFGMSPPSDVGRNSVHDAECSTDEDFPAVLCVAGSTANFLKINRDGSYSYLHNINRCGVFFYSLGKIITGCKTYGELMSLAQDGYAPNLSICLDEILTEKYGDVDGIKLTQHLKFKAETLPFGRIIKDDTLIPSKPDLARALLHTVVDGILNVSILIAKELKTHQIYFAGSFLRENEPAMLYLHQMPYASMHGGWIVNPRFFQHDNYMGVLGAVISSIEDHDEHFK